ncbi:MAG: cadherin domain-containing protein, partial [Planctomycetota bacterium]
MFWKRRAKKSDKPESQDRPKQARLDVESLEKRVLLSASWVDADTGDAQDGATANSDAFSGSAGADIAAGMGGEDILAGNGGNDILSGGEGNDSIQGGEGDDVLAGNSGNDTLDGGTGTDLVDYSDAAGPVTVDITLDGVAQDTSGDGVDTLTGIEAVKGSSHDDTFAFSQPADGAAYSVDGNGGSNTIDLGQVASSDAVVGSDRIVVQTDDGSFQIDHANVASVSFADVAVETPDADAIDQHDPAYRWHFTDRGAVDLAGDSTGTLEGDAAANSDGSATFDGSDYVVLEHRDGMMLDEGTVHLRFNADDINDRQGLLSKDSTGYDDGGHITIWVDDGEIEVRLQSNSQSITLTSDVGLSSGDWHDVSVSFGQDGVQLFVNGELAASDSYGGGLGTSSGGSGNTEPIVVGANAWQSGDGQANNLKEHFTGQIADVAIFADQLAAAEIAELADLDADIPDAGDAPVEFTQGLTADYFEVNSRINRLSDIDWDAEPDHTETVGNIDIASHSGAFWDGGTNDTFAARYTGYIEVDQAGEWTFETNSDDGSMLLINGETVVGNDGLHAMRTESGTIELEPGYHEIEVRYFENTGGAGIQVSWEPPDGGGTEIIPDSAFFHGTPPSDGSGDDIFDLTGSVAGDVHAIDGGEGNDTIDLSTFGSDRVTFGDGQLSVATDDGGSFSVTYENIETIEFADGTATIIQADLVDTPVQDGDLLIDGGYAVQIQTGSGDVSVSYQQGSGAVQVASASDSLTLESHGDSPATFDLVNTASRAAIVIDGDAGAVDLQSNAFTGTLTINGDAGSVSVEEDLAGDVTVSGDLGSIAVTDDLTADATLRVDGDAGTIEIGRHVHNDADISVSGHVETVDIGGSIEAGSSVAIGSAGDVSVGTNITGTLGVVGDVGSLTVTEDIRESVSIGGNIGSLTVGDDVSSSASVQVAGDAGSIVIADDVTSASQITVGGHVGTLELNQLGSESVITAGSAGDITIKDQMSGSLEISADAGAISVAKDVRGPLAIQGDAASVSVGIHVTVSGSVNVDGHVGSLTIGQDIQAGAGVTIGSAGTASIQDDLIGRFESAGNVDALTIGDDIYEDAAVAIGGDVGRFVVGDNVQSGAGISVDGFTELLRVSDQLQSDATVSFGSVEAIEIGTNLAGNITVGAGTVDTIEVGKDVTADAQVVIGGDLNDFTAEDFHSGTSVVVENASGTVTFGEDGGQQAATLEEPTRIEFDGDRLILPNEAPTDLALSASAVAEDASAGTVVGSVAVTDPDAGESFTYALTDDADGRFEVTESGDIRVADGAVFDHETSPSHSVTIEVTDSAGHTIAETFDIEVDDVNESPTDIWFEADHMRENNASEDILLAVVDPDGDTEFGFTVSDDRFEVHDDDGEYTLRLKDGITLDHETEPTVSITVTATDEGGASFEKALDLTVGDVNESPVGLGFVGGSVDENAPAGTSVATASATDPDADTLTYSLVDDANGAFAIDASTGEVVTTAELDFESSSSHTVTVRAVDPDGLSIERDLTVTVGDVNESPVGLG